MWLEFLNLGKKVYSPAPVSNFLLFLLNDSLCTRLLRNELRFFITTHNEIGGESFRPLSALTFTFT
jgi:hypothetical protein